MRSIGQVHECSRERFHSQLPVFTDYLRVRVHFYNILLTSYPLYLVYSEMVRCVLITPQGN